MERGSERGLERGLDSLPNHSSIIPSNASKTATKMPLTLLTLPAEIRLLIWDYCLVSPTQRILPAQYWLDAALERSPYPSIWFSSSISELTARTYLSKSCRDLFRQTLHFIPCAPTTATILSRDLHALNHSLSFVNNQVYTETFGRLLSANTLVFPNYASAWDTLAYLGLPSLCVRSIELVIGNVWELNPRQMPAIMETLKEVAKIAHFGGLGKLRLVYVDGGESHRGAFHIWKKVLLDSNQTSEWGGCEREVVWEEQHKMKTGKLREVLARRWGLEGGMKSGWDERSTDEDWEQQIGESKTGGGSRNGYGSWAMARMYT